MNQRKRASQGKRKKPSVTKTPAHVLQFRIELLWIEPAIWRRIQVPESYSFWDLHVAIQDVMGWLDYHLHAFRVVGFADDIGIPDEEGWSDVVTRPGWKFPIGPVFSEQRPLASYEYDFGDSWVHEVRFEDMLPVEKGVKYPRCVAGARRCPPEDCGGHYGYELFLKAIADPSHPEHESYLQWVGGSFDPEEFDPTVGEFDDPKERWKIAFQEPPP